MRNSSMIKTKWVQWNCIEDSDFTFDRSNKPNPNNSHNCLVNPFHDKWSCLGYQNDHDSYGTSQCPQFSSHVHFCLHPNICYYSINQILWQVHHNYNHIGRPSYNTAKISTWREQASREQRVIIDENSCLHCLKPCLLHHRSSSKFYFTSFVIFPYHLCMHACEQARKANIENLKIVAIKWEAQCWPVYHKTSHGIPTTSEIIRGTYGHVSILWFSHNNSILDPFTLQNFLHRLLLIQQVGPGEKKKM